MAARSRIAVLLLSAAVFIAAVPASAQTNDPNLTEDDLECLRRHAAGGPECVLGQTPAPENQEFQVQGVQPPGGQDDPVRGSRTPDDADQAGSAAPADPSADDRADTDVQAAAGTPVLLPELIVDLFPNPPPGPAPEPVGPTAPAGGTETAQADPQPAEPPAPPPLAPGSLTTSPLVAPPVAVQGTFVSDEALVAIVGGATVAAEIAAAFGLEIRSQRTSTLLGSTLVRFGIPDGRPVGLVLAQLAGDGRATRRAPNHIYDLQQAAGVVNYAFQRIALSSDSATGENVAVAVIDTALDETHPAIKDAIVGLFDAMPGVEVTARDHGTSVAGLIAGTGEFRGMAPGSKIFHARAFEGGKSNMDIILSALDWAAEQDVRIVNMSFVGPKNELLEAACAAARGSDIVLVAAAGNNGPKAPYGYPAAYEAVIAVTATDSKDALMRQANRGPYIFVAAPGVDVIAPVGGGADLVTGTSFAAAVVSGAIANLIHAAPDRSVDWIEAALSSTAKDLGQAGRDSDFGYGLIDITAAGGSKDE